MEQVQKKNILGTEPIGGLLRQFAVPSIIAMLVGALYNIVDQFFIGRSVGELECSDERGVSVDDLLCGAGASVWNRRCGIL